MTQQPLNPHGPSINLRGAVDLSSLAPRRPGTPTAAAGSTSGAPASSTGTSVSAATGTYVIEVTDTNFATDVVERSSVVPVVLDFWATWCEPCKQLSPALEQLAAEFDGRFLLGTVDVDAYPQLGQAFQVQSIPSVFAVIKGQPVPLFQGAQPPAQVRAVLTELLRVAEANGVNGQLRPADLGAVPEALAEPEEEPLPPLHQAAYDAIERDDLDAAVAAYEAALLESPADDMARVGLAQVRLLVRTRDADLAQARAAAAAAPADVAAQILVADLDVLGGHIEDAFSRLVSTVRITFAEDRDQVRAHLVELFDVVGSDDPRVGKARLALANALF